MENLKALVYKGNPTPYQRALAQRKFEGMIEKLEIYKNAVKEQKGNNVNGVLASAASWWDNLTTFKRKLYIGRHYSDNTPTPDKINTLYKMYNDWSSEDLEQVSSCR